MDTLFLVLFKGNFFLYNKEGFLNFALKQKRRDWDFLVGNLNSNKVFTPSVNLTEAEFLNLFNPEEIQLLLQYKITKFAGQTVTDKMFFKDTIHKKYGKRVGWNSEYD